MFILFPVGPAQPQVGDAVDLLDADQLLVLGPPKRPLELQEPELPLRRIWLLTPRPSIPPGYVIARGEKPGGGKTDFTWLIFERGYTGKAEVDWLHRDGDKR